MGGSDEIHSTATGVLHGEGKGSIEKVAKFETAVGDEPAPGAEGDDVKPDGNQGRDRDQETEEGDEQASEGGGGGSQAAAYNEETGEINVSFFLFCFALLLLPVGKYMISDPSTDKMTRRRA